MTLQAYGSPFSDPPSKHWASNAITTLSQYGILSGFPAGVFSGKQSLTRYEAATLTVRLLAYLDKEKPPVSRTQLEMLKTILAGYQDEIENFGLRFSDLENAVTKLESIISEAERVLVRGQIQSRAVVSSLSTSTPTGNDSGKDTTFTDAHWLRPYSIFPVKSGTAETSRGFFDVTTGLNAQWDGGGRLATYQSVGEALNGLIFGVTPPFLNNPFEENVTNNNLKMEVDQLFLKNKDNTLSGEIGSFFPQHTPRYLYAGVPNLTENGPDFLPSFGGRLEADMKPYLVIAKAFAEFFAGKLPQSSPWQTQIFGFNTGIELLGANLQTHWMTAQNDPANFPAGTSGLVTSPINNNQGWLDPTTLSPLAVGPQKEKVWGLDLSYSRNIQDRPVTLSISYANSDYKPNTNSSNNAKGELYHVLLQGSLIDNLTLGGEYLNVNPKYNPFILPFSLPNFISLTNFPFSQWPFRVNFPGYFTLQNAEEYPHNREGFQLFTDWLIPKGKIYASYRWLIQKIPTQLTSFNNDVDIQSIGFFEPLFLAGGGRPQPFPYGTTQDWNFSAHYDLRAPLAFELMLRGVTASRKTSDVNDVDLSGWLGHAGFIYSFWERWKINLAYHRAQGTGRLLANPTDTANFLFNNSGAIFKVDYDLAQKTNAFLQLKTFNHAQLPLSSNFRLIQLLTGLDYSF